ncbi:hypothetical protein MKW94_030245 [Papaver nudicaule]|uniref:F-box domain-containing protein n=1 Tax=Papaver nudicaule TaxID=74823 RepID=A0AA41VZI4_PAPNU|nr:hypothetical protein [Papaver nudicaule]
MAKRICSHIVIREPVDQISTLPDDVLVRILSLVPTEQAVTTRFLSKRWKSLRTLLAQLDLDYVSFCKSYNIKYEEHKNMRFHKFLEFVDYVFTHHQVKHLPRLRFAFNITHATHKQYGFKKNYSSEVRKLVRF